MSEVYSLMSKDELLEEVIRQNKTVSNLQETVDGFAKKFAEAESLTNMGFWEWDIPNDVVTWSDQVYKNYDLEIGTKITYDVVTNRIHPEDRDYHNKLTEEWIQNKGGEPYEYRIVIGNGDIRYIRGYGKVECDSHGEPIKFFGATQDITKQITMQQKLDEAEKEKEKIHHATINGAQHINYNLLNGLKLVELEIKNHPDFDKEISSMFDNMMTEAKSLMKELSTIDKIEDETIRQSIYPKVNT